MGEVAAFPVCILARWGGGGGTGSQGQAWRGIWPREQTLPPLTAPGLWAGV